jgi:hypothetical protein
MGKNEKEEYIMTRTSRETAKRPYKKRMECDQAKMISPPEGGVGDSWRRYISKKRRHMRMKESVQEE